MKNAPTKPTRNVLGTSDLEVAPLAIGCWVFAGDANWGVQSERDSTAVVHAALDSGLCLYDTAPGYGDGESERVLGQALEGRRDEAIIADKVPDNAMDAKAVRTACERSLQLLRTDHIDLYQVHWPSREVPFEETISALQRLQQEGKIRHIGVCNFGPADLEEWLAKGGEVVTNQLPYSLLFRAIEYDIQPLARDHRISVLPYCPLMQGLLTGKFADANAFPTTRARTRHFRNDRELTRHAEPGCEWETFAAIDRLRQVAQDLDVPMAGLSLAWLMAQETVGTVIMGARSIAQLEQNRDALAIEFTAELDQVLREATAEVKNRLGPNPDMWRTESRFR